MSMFSSAIFLLSIWNTDQFEMGSRPSTFVNNRNPQTSTRAVQAPPTSIQNIRTGWFWIAGISGFCISIYCTSVFLGWRAAWEKSKTFKFEQDADVSDRYDKIATRYDEDLDLMERVMLIGGKRRKICQKAKGHVLEVSAGTGRNGGFYNMEQATEREEPVTIRALKEQGEKIRSITFVDKSQKMLDICSKRWAEQHPDFRGPMRFVVADVGVKDAITPPPGSVGFDTIIQTFGLCSTTDPVDYMRRMGSLLKKPREGQEEGRILLLEHGRGHYWWINYVLDGLAKEHADRFGCWWNRDIGKIVKDSGLKVVELKRYHFGTTWAFELTHPDVDNDAVNTESKKTN